MGAAGTGITMMPREMPGPKVPGRGLHWPPFTKNIMPSNTHTHRKLHKELEGYIVGLAQHDFQPVLALPPMTWSTQWGNRQWPHTKKQCVLLMADFEKRSPFSLLQPIFTICGKALYEQNYQ